MASEKILGEEPLTQVEVRAIMNKVEQRDEELSYVGKKVKEHLYAFVNITEEQKKEVYDKLLALDNKRLKEEHYVKIIDFLPKTVDELKTVLQGYPLSLPKKDQEAIVAIVKDTV